MKISKYIIILIFVFNHSYAKDSNDFLYQKVLTKTNLVDIKFATYKFGQYDKYKFKKPLIEIKNNILDKQTVICLANAIYYEARNQSLLGQYAVGEVVFNRVQSKYYPNNVCDVVYQKDKDICQFTFACDGSMLQKKDKKLYQQAELIAGLIISGLRYSVTGYATHYHADYVKPLWAYVYFPTRKIGNHIFYSTDININPILRRVKNRAK